MYLFSHSGCSRKQVLMTEGWMDIYFPKTKLRTFTCRCDYFTSLSPVFTFLPPLLVSHACWKLKMMLCPLWPRCQSCAVGGIDQACLLPPKEIHAVKKVCLFLLCFFFSLSLKLEENNVCHLRRTHQEAEFYFWQTWQRKVWRLERKWVTAWSFEWHSQWYQRDPFKHYWRGQNTMSSWLIIWKRIVCSKKQLQRHFDCTLQPTLY